MTNQISFKKEEFDLSSTVDVAKLLVATIRDLNERVKALEQEVLYLKEHLKEDD
jgi:hypothetical protein